MTVALAKTSTSGWLLTPGSFGELMQFCELIAKSDLAPKDYKNKPGNCIVAIQLGAAVGLSPIQSLQGIAVINGKPSMYGDALLAVIQSSGSFKDMHETLANGIASCTMERVGRTPVVRTFSIDDAKKAQLWGKGGPWTQYPQRMLQMRARAFAARDLFADVLMGLQSAEEVTDYTTTATVVERAPAKSVQVESRTVAAAEPHAPERKPVDIAGKLQANIDLREGDAFEGTEGGGWVAGDPEPEQPATPPPAAKPAEPLRFAAKYPECGGQLIEEATASAILRYIEACSSRALTPQQRKHIECVQEYYEQRIAAEMDADAGDRMDGHDEMGKP